MALQEMAQERRREFQKSQGVLSQGERDWRSGGGTEGLGRGGLQIARLVGKIAFPSADPVAPLKGSFSVNKRKKRKEGGTGSEWG